MLYNYLKVATRNLLKYFTYSSINIFGLALGITASLLIFIYVAHDFSEDKFHKNLDNLYILYGKLNLGGNELDITGMSPAIGGALSDASADISGFVRIKQGNNAVIRSDADHLFNEKLFIFADPSFLTLFSFPLKQGDPATCLSQPNSVLITERAAAKYFGTDNPVGKLLTYNKNYEFKVTGIIKNPPSNSSIQFDFIGSFVTLAGIETEKQLYNETKLGIGNYQTYFLVNTPNNAAKIEAIANDLVNRPGDTNTLGMKLYPFLEKKLSFGEEAYNKGYNKIFLGVAGMIMLLALINYVNLTTARATTRAKEVSIRKVSGAYRRSIISQFYGESIFSTTLAFVLAIAMLQAFASPLFNSLQIRIDPDFMVSPLTIGLVATLYILCIVLGGSYPAIVLSRFTPAQILKGKTGNVLQGTLLRKGLTIFQFTVSVALIFCSLVIQEQLEFMREQKIGINREQTMVVTLENANQYKPVKNQLEAITSIKHVTGASKKLFTIDGMGFLLKTSKSNQSIFVEHMIVDKNFIQSMGIEWLQKPQGELKAGDWILNQAAVEKLELDSLPVGQHIPLNEQPKLINGVVRDFNSTSLRTKVGPIIMGILDEGKINGSWFASNCNVFITFRSAEKLNEQVADVQAIIKQSQPDAPFEYYFLDDAFDRLYKSEDRMISIFRFFTGLAVIIACMGLFGLITLAAQTRIKEISIRKVLGASVGSITRMLSKQFLLLIGISCCIAGPIAYVLMDYWLEDFAFRIQPGILTFAISSGLAVVLSLIIIGTQAIRAALANPVNSLRSE